MKIKIRSIIFLIFVFLTANAQAYAATITGNAYSENIGIIHFDYSTTVNPFDACTTPATPNSPNCPLHADYGTYHLGVRNDFYLPSSDDNYSALGASDFTASIENLADCDTGSKYCLLKGFIWSDAIGWIILNGETIRLQAFGGDAGKFPDSDFAKVDYNDPTKGIFKGYMWSEYTGWIKLSSDTFDPEDSATATNWGVWMDIDEELSPPITNPNCETKDETACNSTYACRWNISSCVARTIPLGRPLKGFAWSEYLGWIKFTKEATDTSDFGFGAYSIWVPDTTPPVWNLTNYQWYANDSAIGLLQLPLAASDPESGIDIDNSEITVTLHSSADFTGCEILGAGDVMSYIPSDNPDSVNLNVPRVGVMPNTPKGFCAYTITGKVKNTAGLELVIPETTFYIRAGDFMYENSSVAKAPSASPSIIADGKDYIQYNFSTGDIAGNPVVPVQVAADPVNGVTFDVSNHVIESADPADWVRNVGLDYSFYADNIFFNTISAETPSNPSTSIPVKVNDLGVSASGMTYLEENMDGEGIISFGYTPEPNLSANTIQVASYAPTEECGTNCESSNFTLNKIEITVDDKLPVDNPSILYAIDETTSNLEGANPMAATAGADFEFKPALTVSDGSLDTDTLLPSDNVITASFKINNKSGESLDSIAIDNVPDLNNKPGQEAIPGFGEEVLYFHTINISKTGYIDDGNTSRQDPIAIDTRYEIFRGTPASTANDGANTVFHTPTSNLYDPSYNYYYDFELPSTLVTIGENGSYAITGTVESSEPDPEDIIIDRSDYMDSLTLLSGTLDNLDLSFKLGDLFGAQFTKAVEFSLKQYLAYRMSDGVFPYDFAAYDFDPVISDIEVKRIGVQATGIVTGEKVYQTVGDREFETVTAPGLSDLKEQMRDNVADITRGIDECWPGPSTPLTGTLSTENSGCLKVDSYNNTVIAFYGNEESTLMLGDDTSDVIVPDGFKYTIIVKGGANVFIKNNIKYENAANKETSFGIIVLADEDGNGGNVYISPDVTNVVGLLYAEGSIMSSPDGTDFYYIGTADTDDLDNQLYWKGSIVSRNTIGGSANRVRPEDTPCYDVTDTQICARAYDLDYIRRFVVNSTGRYVSDDALFSGGGSCTLTAPPNTYECTDDTSDGLPSLITIGGDNLIDLDNSKTDPFYIEKDTRPVPPGFSTSAGFERTQEIR